MRTIYKYELHPDCEIDLPAKSHILSVGSQGNSMFIWAMVDTDNPPLKRRFKVYGTGHAIEEIYIHPIGTVHLYGGSLVFHVFEVLG